MGWGRVMTEARTLYWPLFTDIPRSQYTYWPSSSGLIDSSLESRGPQSTLQNVDCLSVNSTMDHLSLSLPRGILFRRVSPDRTTNVCINGGTLRQTMVCRRLVGAACSWSVPMHASIPRWLYNGYTLKYVPFDRLRINNDLITVIGMRCYVCIAVSLFDS